jgi:hypothetical protein
MDASFLGLITNVEVCLRKTDPAWIENLAQRSGMAPALVKKCMRNNILTVQQFADLCGLDVSTVNNMTRPSVIGEEVGTRLNYCFPFPDKKGRGPKYIVRDEKSEKYLKA